MKNIKSKIKVGMWTKLPEGKVQEDTKDIAEVISKISGAAQERHLLNDRAGSEWEKLIITSSAVRLQDGCGYVDELPEGVTFNDNNFIPYSDLQELLKPECVTSTCRASITDLRNTKIDLRKPDGSVDQELSKAFQEACFEQNLDWIKAEKLVAYLDRPLLGCSGNYLVAYEDQIQFDGCLNRQINFTYERKFVWEATEITPTENQKNTITLFGEEYDADKLKSVIDLLKDVKVS